MEARLLASVVQTDVHKRLQASDELIDYLKQEDTSVEEFPEIDRLISGLASWMGNSNFKVSVRGMEIITVMVSRMKVSFKPHLPTVFPNLRERLGDAKEQVREQAQTLTQQILQDVVSSPQVFLDKLLEACFAHKNWRVKEQGLLCLSRTLSYFGSGQISVSRYMAGVCSLLGDANSQVRSCAMETIVEIYRHVGFKVRIDLSRRNLQASKMSQLTARFDAVDATTGSHESEDVDDDRGSISSAGSSASARTFGSTRSFGSSRGNGRPASVARMASSSTSSSGALGEEDFLRAFEDTPQLNLFTQNDVEKTMRSVDSTLSDPKKEWGVRISALKELRSVVKNETTDHTHFLSTLRSMEPSIILSLKDLRSQVVREACVTLSCMSVEYGQDFTQFAELVFPYLIMLLSNSAKVMASSAEVCLKMIIKNTPNCRILTPLSNHGLASKSPVIRRSCAELFHMALATWSTAVFDRKSVPLVESTLRKGMLDPDASTRKYSRRTYWLYSGHFPENASRMLESFDPQLQKNVIEEKSTKPGTIAPPATHYNSLSLPRPKKKNVPRHTHTESDLPVPTSPRTETQQAPSLRLIRPTIRSPRSRHKTDPAKPPLRSASSMDDMLDRQVGTSVSPIPRPPSRTEVRERSSGMRPPSRSGKATGSGYGQDMRRPASRSGGRLSRSCQPSPAVSRESSPLGLRPVGSGGTLPRKLKQAASLTTEEMMKLYGYGKQGNKDKEDDDAGSVSSEKSSFSITSEVSINPYSRYLQPVTDLNDLVGLCTSTHWSERKDGIAQLHMLLESSRPFSHADMQKVRAVFKQMFAEPHAKVFSMFLDTLSRFIEEHKEYIDDWLYLMLLRLLHRQGADLLSSVHFKLQLVLEQIRRLFEPDAQFSKMCRIVSDQTQPMNTKVKLAWLEYFLELLPSVEGSDFKDTTEMRQALTKLLGFTTEPKSAEIRKQSQKAVIRLFDLNPATLTLMLSSLSRLLQESANRILKCYVADMSSSGDESDREKQSSPKKSPSGEQRKSPRTPSSASAPRLRPKTPSSGKNPMASLPPSAPRGMGSARTISSSTPNMLTPGPHSRIPTPGSRNRSGIPTPRATPPRRPMSTTPGSTPRTGRRRVIPPRAQSVGPEKLAEQLANSRSAKRSRVRRPGSATSDYTPSRYQNGGRDVETPLGGLSPESSVGMFSFSDLPNLDFGEDQGNDDYLHRDKMGVIVRELTTAKNSKLRNVALQTLFTQARDSPNDCHWEEHFKTVLLRLIELLGDDEANVKMMCLRVLREMLKTQDKRISDYAELTTMKVLKAYADPHLPVNQAAEDVFELLAPAIPSESALSLLAPMVAQEKYPMLLGTIKLITKVIGLADPEYLQTRLGDLVPGVIRGYCHSESSVRKASVFCLVALQARVGDTIKQYLTKLSSSQTKLLELYVKRAQQDSPSMFVSPGSNVSPQTPQ